MKALSPSEQAVIDYINKTEERYTPIGDVESATIAIDGKALEKTAIWLIICGLKSKCIIEYTWVNEELLYILTSNLPQS